MAFSFHITSQGGLPRATFSLEKLNGVPESNARGGPLGIVFDYPLPADYFGEVISLPILEDHCP